MLRSKKRKYENWILPLLVLGISAFLMGFFFDFYYDLNDDTLMRDIMSGVYSGTPDGHNMQTLYPLGAAIALCYRLNGSFPWYGTFLFLCQFGCFFAVGVRLCSLADVFFTGRRFIGKLFCLLGLTLFQWGIWLTHMVNVQYTITSGMLVAAAVFLFVTVPDRLTCGNTTDRMSDGSSAKLFLKRSMPSLLLFLLAFHLRTEMAMLVLPFLGLAGVFRWWEDRPVFTGNNLKKYGVLLLLLFVGVGLSLGVDAIAYGGEWQTFRQFFDDRTTVYDFYPEVITGDRYGADLKKLGASYGSLLLLENYNFGLDERIDAQMLSDVAAYAKEQADGAKDWGKIVREKFLLYRYRIFHREDAPYNLLIWIGYASNIIAIVILSNGKTGKSRRQDLFAAAVQYLLIFLVRSVFWMLILMWERDPERITHPLYLAEFCLLAGLFARRLLCSAAAVQETADVAAGIGSASGKADSVFGSAASVSVQMLLCGAAAAVCLLAAAGLVKGVPAVRTNQAMRQETNRDWEAIDDYCRAHPDRYYFEDVYSTVAFSGKLLECRDNTIANYDIAGGWICKSPLYRTKLAAFGIEDAADALADGRADLIMSDGEYSQRETAWMTVLYDEKGMDVYVGDYDRIGENFGVYQVIPRSEDGAFLREAK